MEDKANITPVSIKLNFADVKLPEIKKAPGKIPYLKFGEENKFPESLLYLFNKSAKHNAIVVGKSNYIIGNGLHCPKALPHKNRRIFHNPK